MKTNEIREKYLEFFKTKGHTVCPSDVLVPKWDKTVLFTPAGMNQFKDHFLGKVELDFTRATTSQKCLRTGDIENVGRTAYHHTFFEMLGNFSFGDYFKKEAILWAWEFLTDPKWLGIEPDRLTVSVYRDDDEAADIWHQDVGLSPDRIERLGEHDNFWPAGAPTDGPDGVCGPCSEIFYHPENGPECEIWNLVFTQFERSGDPPNNLNPLPSKNIDTGMGLERIAATLQGVTTNYHIDTLRPLVEAAAEVVGCPYDAESDNGRRLRRIADHVRACTMAIHENVYPGSQKEEYVIRRLLRRAVLQGHEMGLRDPFLFQLVPVVVDQMSVPYPDLHETADRVAQVIQAEEKSFLGSLDEGLARIESIFHQMEHGNQTRVDGEQAADLYTTYGIPAEMFASMAEERSLTFDWDRYHDAMERHGQASGKGSKGVMGNFGPIDEIKQEVKASEFTGYESTESEGKVVGLVNQIEETVRKFDETGQAVDETIVSLQRVATLKSGESDEQFVVLDRTPFYAEAGGQTGDTGWLVGPHGKFQVLDTQKNGEVVVHVGRMTEGEIREGEPVTATVDAARREAVCRAHSATHVLHFALQQALGQHAQQRGSKVIDDHLRFDFSNQTAVERDALATIERTAIEKIEQGGGVVAEVLPLSEARKQGAMMLFGEKYPDPVRMVSIGDFSKELCGGTHLSDIGDAQAFEILSEESVSSGTRRIQAVTGKKAKMRQEQTVADAQAIAQMLGVSIGGIPSAIKGLADRVKGLKKQLAGKGSANPPSLQPEGDAGGRGDQGELSYFQVREMLRTAAGLLNIPIQEVASRVTGLQAEVEKLEQQLKEMGDADAIDADDLIAGGEACGDVTLIVGELPATNPGLMRQLVDQIRKKKSPVAIFFATSMGGGKVLLVAGVSRDLVERGIHSGDWIREIAPIVGGGGGGKPDFAQAGGKKPEKMKEAIEKARDYIRARLAD